MRRWLKQLFPVVMLAVLVQILAPISTIRAAAVASDPFNNVPICSAHLDSADNSSSPDDPSAPSHGLCCPLCAVGQAFALPPVDPVAAGAVSFSYSALVWVGSDERTLAHHIFGSAQARAPPPLS